MGDWDRTFGEAGMQDGFIDGMINQWNRDLDGQKVTMEKMTLVFENANHAMEWARLHPGSAIVRHPHEEGEFIARTWCETFDGCSWFGSKRNIQDSKKEERRKKEVIEHARRCMERSGPEAEWLYCSGHKQLLEDEYELHLSNVKNPPPFTSPPSPTPNGGVILVHRRLLKPSAVEDRRMQKFGEHLEALLPPDISEIPFSQIKEEDNPHSKYEIKDYVNGWLGLDDSAS